ncbi:MAG: hypothetical protein D6746_11400 [Bacteroidetes bacterium]|nr:MAG: hypothetical protein D6746_11400 [Bacteroidota bacterium]
MRAARAIRDHAIDRMIAGDERVRCPECFGELVFEPASPYVEDEWPESGYACGDCGDVWTEADYLPSPPEERIQS